MLNVWWSHVRLNRRCCDDHWPLRHELLLSSILLLCYKCLFSHFSFEWQLLHEKCDTNKAIIIIWKVDLKISLFSLHSQLFSFLSRFPTLKKMLKKSIKNILKKTKNKKKHLKLAQRKTHCRPKKTHNCSKILQQKVAAVKSHTASWPPSWPLTPLPTLGQQAVWS